MRDNIILIGMPSSGKSTIGRRLAQQIGYEFCDTDDVIKEQNGCSLQDIIDREGLDAFRQREEDAVCSVSGHHMVIATGGSVIYSPRGMEHLKALGCVVFLDISYETLLRRVGDPRARGIAIPKDFTFLDLYQERVPLYRKYSSITIRQDEQESSAQTLKRLMRLLA